MDRTKIHQEIVEEALRDNNEKRSLFKHPFIIALVGILLLGIFLGSYIAYSPISKTLENSFDSALIDSNIVEVNDLKLFFHNNTAEEITDLYLQEQDAEFSLCLFGEKQGEAYAIYSYLQPIQHRRTFNQVVFEPCPPQTLILFHTHPYKSCLASGQDITTLRQSQQGNHQMLMVIMCEPTRFAVYD